MPMPVSSPPGGCRIIQTHLIPIIIVFNKYRVLKEDMNAMTMNTMAQERYEAWLNDASIDAATKAELAGIAGNEQEITDRFYKELEFGTGGLRGVIGAGSNRMNIYTVGKATQGLAQYLKGSSSSPSVAIAYDSRHFSPDFALEAALVLAGNGIKAYVFPELRPTPELSFAVRHLQASAGIVITASHNPPEYNGYKVYGSDGGQITKDTAGRVIAEIRGIHSFADIRKADRAEAEAAGLLVWLDSAMDDAYISAVTAVSRNPETIRQTSDQFRVLYTPLHGTGNKPCAPCWIASASSKCASSRSRSCRIRISPRSNRRTRRNGTLSPSRSRKRRNGMRTSLWERTRMRIGWVPS